MQNSTAVLTFSVLHRKYLFCANLLQKMKILGLSWNLSVSTKFQFKPTNLIFGPNLLKECISGVKQKKWAPPLEFSGDVHFYCFWPEVLILGKFGPKHKNCQFKLKFGTYTNSNMQNSMVVFTFFKFRPEILFWSNWFQKIKIVVSAEIWYPD